jgi:hypothetical protein
VLHPFPSTVIRYLYLFGSYCFINAQSRRSESFIHRQRLTVDIARIIVDKEQDDPGDLFWIALTACM